MKEAEWMPVVFFLGDVALDEYYWAPYWPQIKDKVVVKTLPPSPGGMIANAACVMAALGAETHFMAALNHGHITDTLVADLQKKGIETRWTVYDKTLPDAKTIIILTGDEHTVFIPTMGIERIDLPLDTLKFIEQADYLYTNLVEFQTVALGEKNALTLLHQIREAGCKVVFDMDVDPLLGDEKAYLKAIDYLFMNENGFRRMKENRTEQECREEILKNGVELFIVTKGAKGCSIFTQNQEWHVPGFAVDVVDVTGAGDTFASSFIYALHKWRDPLQAAVFASASAARCVGTMGARGGVSSEREILQFIQKHRTNYSANESNGWLPKDFLPDS